MCVVTRFWDHLQCVIRWCFLQVALEFNFAEMETRFIHSFIRLNGIVRRNNGTKISSSCFEHRIEAKAEEEKRLPVNDVLNDD